MGWCCIFHVTRDSINVIKETLQNEPIKVLGHTQWIWNPNEFGIKNYRFIHFYRKPYKKIISGYRYHKDGAEDWCLKSTINYTKSCDFSSNEIKSKIIPYTTQIKTKSFRGDDNKYIVPNNYFNENHLLTNSDNIKYLTREKIQDYCESVHLCQTCCRKEHEITTNAIISNNKPKSIFPNIHYVPFKKLYNNTSTIKNYTNINNNNQYKDGKHKDDKYNNTNNNNKLSNIMIINNNIQRKLTTYTNSNSNSKLYIKNPQMVYDFQCRNLGPMSELSLTETLNELPPADGLKVEASIDYYETLRMAKIFNNTWNDPYTLNIDLDELMKDYSGTMRKIIIHMDIDLSSKDKENLATELDFFDINNSPAYRWSMTNPLVNHIDTKRYFIYLYFIYLLYIKIE